LDSWGMAHRFNSEICALKTSKKRGNKAFRNKTGIQITIFKSAK